MISVLRIFDGHQITDYNAAAFTKFSIGAQPGSDYICTNPDSSTLTFSYQNGSWRVRIRRKDGVSEESADYGRRFLISLRDRQMAMLLSLDQFSTISVQLRDDPLAIGRNPDCAIPVPDDETVSKIHARIWRENGGCRLEDAGSSSGTYKLGNADRPGGFMAKGELVKSTAIQIGDIFVIGKRYFTYDGKRITTTIPEFLLPPEASAPVSTRPVITLSPRIRRKTPPKRLRLEVPPSIMSKPEMDALFAFINPLYYGVRYALQAKKYKKQERLLREKYTQWIRSFETEMETHLRQQLSDRQHMDPDVETCARFASERSRRLWERSITDDDFMTLRVGVGDIPSDLTVESPDQRLSLAEDPLLSQARQLAERGKWLRGAPVTCGFSGGAPVGVVGDRKQSVRLVKNLLLEAAALHPYSELRIVCFFTKEERAEWEWLRWLPQVFRDDRQFRYLACGAGDASELERYMEEVLEQRRLSLRDRNHSGACVPFYLFVFADMSPGRQSTLKKYLDGKEPDMQASAIYLSSGIRTLPKECGTILEVGAGHAYLYKSAVAQDRQGFVLDAVSPQIYEDFSRALAPLRLDQKAAAAGLPSSVSFLEGCGVKRPEQLDIAARWGRQDAHRSMAVPIGVRENGEPFYFDIHEKASGPHGLVAGMTGSGKSEMVQSWILSMAVQFPPSQVSFVLVDFKGTGLLLPFMDLPHLAGKISNLDSKIGRNLIAMDSELDRRQNLFDRHGVKNIIEYWEVYQRGRAETPLSFLFVVMDEFSEVKAQFPEFMPTVERIFKIGRTLGVYILLLTQKPTGVYTDQMVSNAAFKWCLKVASPADSKEMLGRSDAAYITNPGRAYVQVGNDQVYEQIQAYYSGAPYRPYAKNPLLKTCPISVVDLPGHRLAYAGDATTTGFRASRAEIDAVVKYLDSYAAEHGVPRARRVWTDKLADRVVLGDLLRTGFDGQRWGEEDGGLAPVIGLVDDPCRQSQYPLKLGLGDGCVVVYGAPGSGKTTLLQTLLLSLAISYSPSQVHIYGMDFGGWGLDPFSALPHTGGIAAGGEEEKVNKLSQLLTEELARRKKLFAMAKVLNIRDYREATGETLPYIVLVLDNFGPAMQLYPGLDAFFQKLTGEGGGYGMLLAATATSLSAVSFKVKQNIKTSLSLQMTDKSDYMSIVGRTGGLEPEAYGGRGLIHLEGVMEFQTALPGVGPTQRGMMESVHQLCVQMNAAWSGPRPAPIPVMPEVIPFDSVSAGGLTLGLTTQEIAPIGIDLTNPHCLLISGTPQSGKSNLLKVLAKQLLLSSARLIVLSPDGCGIDGIGREAFRYAATDQEMDDTIAWLSSELQRRKEQAADGSLGGCPALAVVIDDWDVCFKLISNQSVRRLEMLVKLGAGLNVCLLTACGSRELERLYSQGDPLTNAMINVRQSVLLGGSFRAHGIFDADLTYSEKDTVLGEYEGYILKQGKAIRFKSLSGE